MQASRLWPRGVGVRPYLRKQIDGSHSHRIPLLSATGGLQAGAIAALKDAGATYEAIEVPGPWIFIAIKFADGSGKYMGM